MMIMSETTLGALSNIAIGSSAPAYRINIDGVAADGNLIAGTILSKVRNQYMGTAVDVVGHPLMPDSKIIFYTKDIDYPDSGVNTNLELLSASIRS